MLDTIYGKTFLILGSQLGITWLSTVLLLRVFRNLYESKVGWVSGETNEDGDLDLELDWATVKPYFWPLMGIDLVVFFGLIWFGESNLSLGIPLFSFWSVVTGIELALCLISVDENLGSKVLALTALITVGAGLIGAKSGVDFSVLGHGLAFCLLLLIGFGLIRILFSITRWMQRLWALFGVAVFTGYLLYDFHRLNLLAGNSTSNSWTTAMRCSINIYLDVINLFLHLLDLLHKLK